MWIVNEMDMTSLHVNCWRGKFLLQTQSDNPSTIHLYMMEQSALGPWVLCTGDVNKYSNCFMHCELLFTTCNSIQEQPVTLNLLRKSTFKVKVQFQRRFRKVDTHKLIYVRIFKLSSCIWLKNVCVKQFHFDPTEQTHLSHEELSEHYQICVEC